MPSLVFSDLGEEVVLCGSQKWMGMNRWEKAAVDFLAKGVCLSWLSSAQGSLLALETK